MPMLLAGSHPVLETLRKQFERSHVLNRNLTGIGFFTSFEILDNQPRIESPRSFLIDDVCAEVDGLDYGCGFGLFISDGLITTLECHLWGDDELPKNASYTRLYYYHQPDPPSITETKERDIESLTDLLDQI